MKWFARLLAGFGAIGAIAFVVIMILLGGICLHYDVTFWMTFGHHPMRGDGTLFWIVCLIAGFFVSSISVPVALITLVLSFFL